MNLVTRTMYAQLRTIPFGFQHKGIGGILWAIAHPNRTRRTVQGVDMFVALFENSPHLNAEREIRKRVRF